VIAGLGCIGVAATPWNHVLDAHNLFVRIAFGFLLAYVLCFTAIQVRNGWPRAFIALNVGYLAALAAYVAILFFGPKTGTKSGLEFQVAAQNVIVYASILNLALQALAIRREAARPPEHPTGAVAA
jgi:hypothetical protein